MATIEEEIAQLKVQQATQTRALRLLIEGRWTGAMPHAAAEIASLYGANPPPDFDPVDFPKE